MVDAFELEFELLVHVRLEHAQVGLDLLVHLFI
jgi:hypothetical protein